MNNNTLNTFFIYYLFFKVYNKDLVVVEKHKYIYKYGEIEEAKRKFYILKSIVRNYKHTVILFDSWENNIIHFYKTF